MANGNAPDCGNRNCTCKHCTCKHCVYNEISYYMPFPTFATVVSSAQKANNNSLFTDSSTQVVYTCIMHPEYISLYAAKCPVCGDDMSRKEVMKAEVMKLDTYSMDNIIPGKRGCHPQL